MRHTANEEAPAVDLLDRGWQLPESWLQEIRLRSLNLLQRLRDDGLLANEKSSSQVPLQP
jgi:hypothetical protein